MLYFGINHEDYNLPEVSFKPFLAEEFEYTDAHTTGEEYVLVAWNDETVIVHEAADTLRILAAKWYNSFNVAEWAEGEEGARLLTTRGFIAWVNKSQADKDSASGYGIFSATGDMIAGPLP